MTYLVSVFFIFFFFNDTATTEIYTLSLHDALSILEQELNFLECYLEIERLRFQDRLTTRIEAEPDTMDARVRSEEHTSELQSLAYLVCRLLLEKKKKKHITNLDSCFIHNQLYQLYV